MRTHPAIAARRLRQRGSLTAEMVIAMSLLALTLLPLSVSFTREQARARALYHRALAIEIVDGEMEVLGAGGWQAFLPGTHAYAVRAESAKNLPPGRFQLTLVENRVRLEWLPESKGVGGPVVREVALDLVARPAPLSLPSRPPVLPPSPPEP